MAFGAWMIVEGVEFCALDGKLGVICTYLHASASGIVDKDIGKRLITEAKWDV